MASELTRLLPHSVRVYRQLRQEIYEFILMPGDRFTEVDIASRLGCSRTPVREALLTLQNDDLIRRCFRNGWEVCPIDFDVYEDLYATRILIEMDTVARLCSSDSVKIDRSVLARLRAQWVIPPEQQEQAGEKIATMDEQFHIALTEAVGNRELTAILSNITDRIRIMRRLDFEYDVRIAQTYSEHAELLEAIENREKERAKGLMREHIEDAHTGACAITLRRLQKVRARNLP